MRFDAFHPQTVLISEVFSLLSIANSWTLRVCLSLLATYFEKSVSTSLTHSHASDNEEIFLFPNKVPVVRVTHWRVTDRNAARRRAKQHPPLDPNGQLHPSKDTHIYSPMHTHTQTQPRCSISITGHCLGSPMYTWQEPINSNHGVWCKIESNISATFAVDSASPHSI